MSNSIAKILTGAILTIFMLGFTLQAQANVKIGYVDMQKAIQATSGGKKAKKSLEGEFNKKKKQLQKREADLKKMGEDLEKKAMVLSDDVRLKKQQALQEEMFKYQKMVTQSNMEIQRKERDLMLPIIKKLKVIIDKIAKAEKYTMILVKSENNVLYAQKEIDLTDRLVKEYEKKK